jgi:hypothetical protein
MVLDDEAMPRLVRRGAAAGSYREEGGAVAHYEKLCLEFLTLHTADPDILFI